MKKALTIAGSDSSGGAGIQADLKTFLAQDVYGMSAITSITAQNTQGVQEVEVLSEDLLAAQLDSIFQDIRPDAVKIGMVGNSAAIEVIVAKLKEYKAENIVLDPVMVATSGSNLFESEDASSYDALFRLATVLTPNVYESGQISGKEIKTLKDLEEAARDISDKFQTAVLAKSGDLEDQEADDILVNQGQVETFHGQRIDNPNVHGSGCTLSSAIAANLAKGHDLSTSVQNAKDYITGAIQQNLDLGQGRGPLDHGYLARSVKNDH